jgi:hypothetical protein
LPFSNYFVAGASPTFLSQNLVFLANIFLTEQKLAALKNPPVIASILFLGHSSKCVETVSKFQKIPLLRGLVIFGGHLEVFFDQKIVENSDQSKKKSGFFF